MSADRDKNQAPEIGVSGARTPTAVESLPPDPLHAIGNSAAADGTS